MTRTNVCRALNEQPRDIVFEENANVLPIVYARLFDDIFMVIQSSEQVETTANKFKKQSLLKFTHEHERAGNLVFLDRVYIYIYVSS